MVVMGRAELNEGTGVLLFELIDTLCSCCRQ